MVNKEGLVVISAFCPYCRQRFIAQPTSMNYHKTKKCLKN
jgi:hypothetical protein